MNGYCNNIEILEITVHYTVQKYVHFLRITYEGF